MYDYTITNEQGQTIQTGSLNSHDADAAGYLVFMYTPSGALILSVDHDKQEQGGWSYSVAWTMNVNATEEEDTPVVWDVCFK
jgi:hypothetical protein